MITSTLLKQLLFVSMLMRDDEVCLCQQDAALCLSKSLSPGEFVFTNPFNALRKDDEPTPP